LFPSDTVYGLACDPSDPGAIDRVYSLKGRPPAKAAAIMFFDLGVAFESLPDIGPRTRLLLQTLLPGPLTVLLPNPERRFALACGEDLQTLGLRVVSVPALAGVRIPVMQSSANPSGGDDPADVSEVDPGIRDGADLVVDGGRLPGQASTVLDLRGFEVDGSWSIVRAGPVSEAVITLAAAAPFHFDPGTYGDDVVHAIHDYEDLQAAVVAELVGPDRGGGLDRDGGLDRGGGPMRILELGVGTGETTRRILAALPGARVVGVDASPAMLAAAARSSLAAFEGRFEPLAATLQEPLPHGEFDAVVSALTIHHLDAQEKADLFSRVRRVLSSTGTFVLGDVVLPAGDGLGGDDPGGDAPGGDAPPNTSRSERVDLTDGFDKPSTAADQVHWLLEGGFSTASVVWSRDDLAVIVARA